MGYRSDVAIAIKNTELKRGIITDNFAIQSLMKATETHMIDDYTVFWIESWKWYPGYKDIDAIDSFLDSIEDEEDYGFLRIGEDADDIEERGSPWEYEIYLIRDIGHPTSDKKFTIEGLTNEKETELCKE